MGVALKIFEYLDYRQFIRDAANYANQSQSLFAKAIGVKDSYLSQVLSGTNNLNNDQLFLLAEYLLLNADEQSFLTLLGEYERSQVKERREYLLMKITSIQQLHLKPTEYYPFDSIDDIPSPLDELLQDKLAPIVDAFLTQDCYLRDIEKLRCRMGISLTRMANIMDILVRSRIIEQKKNRYIRNKKRYFAYKINASAKANACYSRMKVIDSIMDPEKKEDLVTTLVFAANEDFIKKTKAKVLNFAKEHFYPHAYEEESEVFFANTDLITVIGENVEK